ncbi:hypothetical protein DYB26_000126 [Aphanomyces astaci]|uniref:Vacuolar sorting protein 39/Transforming growth factor beta receptor-associated domain-containing protein n=1 Tax=Aphanomyces astaci TaxID=112090 RepID=A0A418FQD5_APHAT|nr:hypothetical protein DYB26_000126 [Aphanomyces astaci]
MDYRSSKSSTIFADGSCVMTDAAAYDVVDVDGDKSYRGIKKAERVLSSIALNAATPTLYVGDSSSSLHAFTVHADKAVRFHQQLKKVYHDSGTQILDSWGVCATIIDGKLATLPLPLDKDSLTATTTFLDETKGVTQLHAHEHSRVLCCLVKQNLMVYDWSVQGKLQLRSSHDLTTDKSNVATSVLCLGGSIAVVQFKKKGLVLLDLDTGVPLSASLPSADASLFVSLATGTHKSLDNLLVTTKDHGIIFAWDSGRRLMGEVGRLAWPPSSVPKAAPVAHHPFVLVPFVDRVDVFNAASFHVAQSIPIKSVSQFSVVTTLATADHHRPVLLLLAPPFHLTLLRMKPIADQLKYAMHTLRYADAVGLCTLCPDEGHLPPADLHQLHLNYALHLFQQHHFDLAFRQFVLGATPLRHVLTLFPEELLPRSVAAVTPPVYPHVSVLTGEALASALAALPAYLTAIRSAPLTDSLELCDTVLLKAYALNNADADLTSFCASPNAADLGESELFLRVHSQWPALLALYKLHVLHRKALDVLDELYTADAVAYEQPLAEYLTQLSDGPLVFEYSRRLLTTRPDVGLAVFTHRHHHHQVPDLDPSLVLHHLKSIDATAPSTRPSSDLPLSDGRYLAIAYLSQLIYTNDVELPSTLHDELVYLLLDAIDAAATSLRKPHQNKKDSTFHVRVHLQRDPELGPLRRHLLTFLQSPLAMYHPERLLSRVPVDMLEERAVLLANMGRHEEVLRLYLHDIRDAALAETYCNECFAHRITDASIYTLFLQTYLRPPVVAGRPPPLRSLTGGIGMHFVAAFMLRHAQCIDVATALALLPPSVEASAVAAYLERVLELKVEQKRHVQVQKQLLKIENLHVRSALNVAKQASVDVDVHSTCDVCARPVERGPVLCHPNGTLLHYACQTSS